MSQIASAISNVFHGLTHSKEPDSKDEIWLMDQTAFRSSSSSGWRAEYVVACFKENSTTRKKVTDAVADLAQVLNLAPDDNVTEERMKERITPFTRDIARHMEVNIKYPQGGQLHLGPSNGSGIIGTEQPVPVDISVKPGETKTMQLFRREQEMPQNFSNSALEVGKTFFAQDGGWGVISDIDDTVKITEVRDRIKLLQNTFVNIPAPVPNMSQLYKQLRNAISTESNPAPFFYLSASPYSLYPMLRTFLRDSAFPEGQIILRDMSWMDMEAFVVSLSMGTQEYKDDRMKKISTWLPRTTWVCIGDSTQTDPEAYAEFFERLGKDNKGGRVARIWIHKVVGVNPSKEKSLNAPERFEKAFKNVPKDIWRLFENATELENELESLKKEVNASGNLGN